VLPNALANALARGAALAAGPPTAEAPVALVPGIAFGWTDPGTLALLGFQVRPGPTGFDRVTGLRLPAKRLTLAAYRYAPHSGKLVLQVRADRPGEVPVRRLEIDLRYAPAQTLRVRAAEVVALESGAGPLALRRWASDDAAGLYAAFALVNERPSPVTVRSLRYAPQRLGRGLVLTQTGPLGGFEAWKDRVLERSGTAFDAYLQAGGHDPRAPYRTPPPASLAFPLAGALAGARWQASDALHVSVAPGEALFLAVTPAAFSAYVDDLAIDAYPVLGYEAAGGCCRLQGVAAPVVNVVPPAGPRRGAPGP